MKLLHTLLLIQLIILLVIEYRQVEGLAVLGVDIGSEWMRIGLVKPGVPMEIVLNKETRRKTPMSVYISLKERLIGEESLSAGIKKPAFTQKYFTRTLGALPTNPLVTEFQENFPELQLQPDTEYPQYLVHRTGYSSEELLAMMLNHSRQLSEDFAEYHPIKDIVLTVPPYFTQAQRRALLRSADLVGIKVLTMMNTNLAVALHFGSFQKSVYKDKPIVVLFYDMGATSTIASIVRYEAGEGKSTVPKIIVLGTGFDRNLGGAHIDQLLARHLAVEFEKQQADKNNKIDILNSHKAMAKLTKEAKRVKNVLNANTAHHAHVESLIGDLDLKILVKRSDLESLCEFTLFNRIPEVISEAIEAAKLSREEIDLVVPVGGASRLKKVGEIVLSELGKTEFTTTINADESAAMGAVYQGAFLSKGFRVSEFQLQDANIYPIEISYEKRITATNVSDTEEIEEDIKTKIVHKHLFYRSNILPQKKIMTFKNITNNLVLHASYVIDQSWLSSYDKDVLTQGEAPDGRDIMRIEINGVEDAHNKYGQEEFKGVKVHFSINENGLFSCTSAEAVFEKISVEQSTLDSILGYFSSSTDKVEQPEDANNDTKQNNTESSQNTTETLDSKNSSNKSTTPSTNKPELLIYPLEIITLYLDYPDPSYEHISQSKQKLLTLALKDEEKRLLELAQNNLEAFIYDLKERLFRDETLALTSEEQREEMANVILKISEWFFDQGADTPKEEYNDKFQELKSHTVDFFIRLRESKELPTALEKLNDTLNATDNFIRNMQLYLNLSSMVFTDADYSAIIRQYNQTTEWLANAIEEQSNLQPYENPTLTVSLVETQNYALASELRYMMADEGNKQEAHIDLSDDMQQQQQQQQQPADGRDKQEQHLDLSDDEDKQQHIDITDEPYSEPDEVDPQNSQNSAQHMDL
ncbi:Hypoxia up-regulated protein 1 isoform X2 [Oopsacas minuta]|uniref:Hypoxia up-regulated protein 1 n=1 Tax=Oopsacas minuta TaxID=111878 RepID=A0AAV7JNZ2_9METZ|nr:Hypoxia up-regulated protein 1 isoform X2 [Oopsacas minuta]